jgi:hypothetical protein
MNAGAVRCTGSIYYHLFTFKMILYLTIEQRLDTTQALVLIFNKNLPQLNHYFIILVVFKKKLVVM